ncbi:RicAFT regulatory complex protein RicA family protein [Paenibacillus sp. 1P07SE]|uniref:RicAFT regulatory complex protein RicA family protein n=1 Tax=Paenibacillus sp. 1P07SE TaxID=3132209 RepID=UPI0039A5FC39
MTEQQAQAGREHKHKHGHGDRNCHDMPSYNTRDLLVKEDVMAKAKELAELISQSTEIQQYQRAEKQIQGNERVQSLIALMKKKQKEIVAFESFNNEAMVKKIEGEMEALQDELDGIPIVGDFQQSQTDINHLLQMVISIIRDTVSEKINLDSEGVAAPEECSD